MDDAIIVAIVLFVICSIVNYVVVLFHVLMTIEPPLCSSGPGVYVTKKTAWKLLIPCWLTIKMLQRFINSFLEQLDD